MNFHVYIRLIVLPRAQTRRLPEALQKGFKAPVSPKKTAPKASKGPKPGEHQSATRADVLDPPPKGRQQNRTSSTPKKESAGRQAGNSGGLNVYYLQAAELRAYLAKQYPDKAQAAQEKAALLDTTRASHTPDDVPAVPRAGEDLSQRSAASFTSRDMQHTPGRHPRLPASEPSSFDILSGLGARGQAHESLLNSNARSHSNGRPSSYTHTPIEIMDDPPAITPTRQRHDSMQSMSLQPRPKRTHSEVTPEPEANGTGLPKRMRSDQPHSYSGPSSQQAAPAASQGRVSQSSSQAGRVAALGAGMCLYHNKKFATVCCYLKFR